MILDHIGFHVTDFEASKAFLLRSLAPLGIGIAGEGTGWAMLGRGKKGHANYYGAFVIGPDGHNFEAVCHAPEA